MHREFVDYAFQDLPRKKIKEYAAQYDGVDMAVLIGADQENFPFLIRSDTLCTKESGIAFQVMVWNTSIGIMTHLDEDPVRVYATVRYLQENAYPVFETLEEATNHDWPRKTWADA